MKTNILAGTAIMVNLFFASAFSGCMMMHDHMMMPGMDDKKMDDSSMAPKDDGMAKGQSLPPGVFSKSDQGLQVMLHFNPPLPKANAVTKAMIMVTNEKSHQTASAEPVTVQWVMGKMWSEVAKQPLKADDSGYFHTAVNFPMAGDYEAIVTVENQGKTVSISFSFPVEPEDKNDDKHK